MIFMTVLPPSVLVRHQDDDEQARGGDRPAPRFDTPSAQARAARHGFRFRARRALRVGRVGGCGLGSEQKRKQPEQHDPLVTSHESMPKRMPKRIEDDLS